MYDDGSWKKEHRKRASCGGPLVEQYSSLGTLRIATLNDTVTRLLGSWLILDIPQLEPHACGSRQPYVVRLLARTLRCVTTDSGPPPPEALSVLSVGATVMRKFGFRMPEYVCGDVNHHWAGPRLALLEPERLGGERVKTGS